MAKISLPNRWQPRAYQANLWRYLETGGKRAVAIWHRRAGRAILQRMEKLDITGQRFARLVVLGPAEPDRNKRRHAKNHAA